MPNDDYYGDGDGAGGGSAGGAAAATNASQSKESTEGEETATLPRNFFGGDCKPGDEYTVRVERLTDDEVVVSYVSEHDESAEGDEGGKAAPGREMAMGGGTAGGNDMYE